MSPIYGFQLLGGQNFYSGQKQALAGNLSGVVAPAMKFNDNWALLPSFNTAYQGTQQVLDIVGAGTLFQQQWDNRVAAKGVYTPTDSNWRIKPGAGFKYQFLQQTADERLGDGLFDYYQWDVGLDAEYVYHDPFSIRMGVDYFQTAYPNYTSLESQIALTVNGQSLARELVGDRTLDTRNVLAMASVDGPVWGALVLQGSASFLYEYFPNQHVVDNTGALTSPLRNDYISSLGVGARLPMESQSGLRSLGALDVTLSYDASSQNNFDATQVRFINHYYSYGDIRVSPNYKFMMGDRRMPVILGIGAAYQYRRYPYRTTQNGAGVYQDKSIHTNNWSASTSLTYPMAQHFNVLFNFQYGRASSNQRFEQYYKYNYTAADYLFGFSYDF